LTHAGSTVDRIAMPLASPRARSGALVAFVAVLACTMSARAQEQARIWLDVDPSLRS
jgi:hypothetical protein